MNLTSWIPCPCECVRKWLVRKYLSITYVGDGNCRNDAARVKVPESQGVGLLDSGRWLQNRQGYDKVRSKNNLLLEVNAQTVRGELLFKNVKRALNIFWPLMDDVTTSISLDKSARGSANGATHVGNEESTVAND